MPLTRPRAATHPPRGPSPPPPPGRGRSRARHFGTVADLPSLSWLAPGRDEAFEGIRQLAPEVVGDMLSSDGEEPPGAIRAACG
ncbi:hypothetical protein [Nocardiopsis alborubida]|uniref:hypothetical protein n=1 Tax=Nocardiopsis alborubida TaxID=146802 RepID=UPI00076E3B61|nr:hypothetical protein [Nocardiopsis alborubida]